MGKSDDTRVMVVDDHSVVRDGVETILERVDGFTVAGMAANADDAIKILCNEKVDVGIIDITLSGTVSGIDLVKAIKERFPDVKLLVMSMHNESVYGERAIKAGANGYLMKDVASLNLVKAIKTIMNDDLYVSEKLQKKIISKLLKGSGEKEVRTVEVLSDREFEIFQLIGNGYSTREIAENLNVSTNTVDSHKNRIKEKMEFESSADLTKFAIQWVILQGQYKPS